METQIPEVYMDHPTNDGRNTGSLKRSSSFKKLLKLPLWGNSSNSSNSVCSCSTGSSQSTSASSTGKVHTAILQYVLYWNRM